MEATPATPEMRFQSPDFPQTGHRSPTRLEADDGTVIRVGANTLFSFEETDHTINLKKGSLIFHSPEGRGGGRIVTASATASFVGTMITVTATEDGGFKLLVLEGTAQVTFPNGEVRILEAGQMTFVLPSEGGTVISETTSGDEAETPLAGKPGPVFNFDLERLREGSRLLNGFGEPLPSDPMIERMIQRQQSRLSSGELKKRTPASSNFRSGETSCSKPRKMSSFPLQTICVRQTIRRKHPSIPNWSGFGSPPSPNLRPKPKALEKRSISFLRPAFRYLRASSMAYKGGDCRRDYRRAAQPH